MSAIAGKVAIDSGSAIIAWLGALAAGTGGNIDLQTAKSSLKDKKIREALGLEGRGSYGGILPNQKDIFDKYELEKESETKKPEPKEPKKPRDPDKPPEIPRIPIPEPRKPDPKSNKPKDGPREIPIKTKEQQITDQKNPQWYSGYKFGGQDILKLTDLEKLEEIRNWTLFDLVNPHLEGDPENLLNIQNKISENRRFNNTYDNPKPPQDFQGKIPAKYINNYHFRDQLPIDYPFRESSVREQQYYDNFSDQESRTNDYLKDLAQRGLDPDFTQIANSKRRPFSADDPKYRKGKARPSLVEAVNINKLSDVDFLIT